MIHCSFFNLTSLVTRNGIDYPLPMYLHSRSTEGDFVKIVRENRSKFSTGVVHSFTGSSEELQEIIDLDLYIGVNGCSLKTEENWELVKHIPLDRIMLETDCPYCDIRNSHFSSKYVKTKFDKVVHKKYTAEKMLKDRNEPCTMIQVLEAVAGKFVNRKNRVWSRIVWCCISFHHLIIYLAIKEVDEKELAEIAWENTMKVFNLNSIQ